MRCGAGTRDQDSEPAVVCRLAVRPNDVPGSMRGHDADLPADAVLIEDLAAGVHHGQVGLTADDDADTHGAAHTRLPAVTGPPMSLRDCMPLKCTRARLPYACARAAARSGPTAVTQSTRPPEVRNVPSLSRRVPA